MSTPQKLDLDNATYLMVPYTNVETRHDWLALKSMEHVFCDADTQHVFIKIKDQDELDNILSFIPRITFQRRLE